MRSLIDRGFGRTASGLIHYRDAGASTAFLPLIMIHGGPGSSAGLVPMITVLAEHRRVIAPDLPGNGDSDPPPGTATSIVSYAQTILEFLDLLSVERFDLYGHHSGAQVACEIAIARPARVRRIVLDGVALFSTEQRREFLARYAPPIVPQTDGGHLTWAWNFANNLTQFFPYYRRDDASRVVPQTILPADAITRVVVDMLKVWPTYHLLYEAAFAHDLAERLPLLAAPVLLPEIMGDPLAQYVAHAAKLLPECQTERITREHRAQAIDAFLKREDPISR